MAAQKQQNRKLSKLRIKLRKLSIDADGAVLIQYADGSEQKGHLVAPEVIQTDGGGVLFMTPERTDEEHDARLAQSLGWEDE